MRFRRFLSLPMAMVLAATVLVGFQPPAAEARGFHGGFRHHGVHHQHRFHGGGFFLGLGLGLVGLPYAYSAYYQPYRSYPAYTYAPYPAYYGACYAYDAYGRCLSYAPPGGYYYPY